MIKNFFNISDLTKEQIFSIIFSEKDNEVLQNKNIGLIFEKYSTRTRLSFNVGITSLGGNTVDLKFQELNISRSESFEDTFRAINCYLDGLVYRTDKHDKLIQASNYFSKPIINALSDYSHPCQTLSDLFTLQEHFGSLNCNILWMGDMNNVCFSLIEAACLIEEITLTICTPLCISSQKNWPLKNNVSIINSVKDIDLKSINCVMTDVFVSMNDEKSKDKIETLKPYIVDSQLMSGTNKDSIFMHCLPAQIGFEVTDEVYRSSQSIIWRQAYNRMVAQKKLLQFIYQ